MPRNFYTSALWQKISKQKRQANPVCEVCGLKAAQQVDHIRSIADGGDKIAWNNLQSICIDCHNQKTQRETKKRKVKFKEYE